MQSSNKHLGQSLGMVALLALTCVGFVTLISQLN